MTHTHPGAAPEHMYAPSYANLALMAMEVTPEHASYGIDPGGIGDGHLRAESLLKRTEAYVPYSVVRELRDERIRQGLSQTVVGLALGVCQDTVSRWEKSKHSLSVHKARQWAELLGIDGDAAHTDMAAD